ncbi:MAG: hypothetical protein E3K37_18365 [Candidatus Kuenenia sp.]|nr:hypothetical protein [Candidatus Kuenenia hertensis]
MSEWKRVKIGDVCTIEKGVTGLAKALPGDYPLVTTGVERKTSRDYQFDTKAVCIPLVSSTGHGKKTLNYVHYQEGKFALGSILSAVVPRDETILDARYLHVYLQKNKDRVLVPLMKGAANVSLSVTAISNIEVPLPPLVEQKKILSKIDSISSEHEDFLNELDVQIDLFGKLRQAVLQEAIEGKLTAKWREEHPELISGDNHASKLLEKIKAEKERLTKNTKGTKKAKALPPISEEEKPFDLPDGWVWCRLGEVIMYSDNLDIQKYLKPTDRVNYVDIDSIDNQKYLIREIKVKTVSELSSRARRVLRPGYLVYSTVRPYLNNLALIEESRPNFIGSTGFCVFKPLIINMKFVKYILLSSYIKDLYLEMLKGFNSPSITNNQFESTFIPLPPLSEQQAIIERVDKLMGIINELEKQVSERKEQSEMLMLSVLREAFAKG